MYKLLRICALAPLVLGVSGLAQAAIINVPGDFATIQGAIDAASPGDIIEVASGAYYEHLVVNKSLTLQGEDRGTTIIHGGGTGLVVNIPTSGSVTISGFTITNGEYGIVSYGHSSSTIRDCEISQNQVDGVIIGWSNNFSITDCIAYLNNQCGIYLDSCRNSVIENCKAYSNGIVGITFYDHPQWCGSSSPTNNRVVNCSIWDNQIGVAIGWAGGTTLKDNKMFDNVSCLVVSGWPLYVYKNDIDTSNTVNGKPVYYLVDKEDMVVDPSTFPSIGYLGLVNSNRITVKDITVTDGSQGVLFAHTSHSCIENIKSASNYAGIWLVHSSDNTITGNVIQENEWGIYSHFSNHNVITGNRITNNDSGLGLYDSSDNTIYHNNFTDNTKQVEIWYKWWAYPYYDRQAPSINIWDDGYPSGGNYWSDWTGTDMWRGINQDEPGADGIGDTPYIIDSDNKDNYPLIIVNVAIDIKPGSYPNAINLGSHGLIPVAILSSDQFDATTVDPETVELAGAGVAVRGKANKYMAHKEDVNADGLVDLVVQVSTENLDPDSLQDGFAVLTGKTFDGVPIEGKDEITIVPAEK